MMDNMLDCATLLNIHSYNSYLNPLGNWAKLNTSWKYAKAAILQQSSRLNTSWKYAKAAAIAPSAEFIVQY